MSYVSPGDGANDGNANANDGANGGANFPAVYGVFVSYK